MPAAAKRKKPVQRTDPWTGLLRANVRIENNKRRALCLTCGQSIPPCYGLRVDDKDGELRGYRHTDCPEPKPQRPKSPKRNPHALGAHVLRQQGADLRVCGVKGCRYAERWDSVAGDWLAYPYADKSGQPRTAEPSLMNMPLFAS